MMRIFDNFDSSIDLHNQNIKTVEELESILEDFLKNSILEGQKKLKIICGRGLHSKYRPLLKPFTKKFLNSRKNKYRYIFTESIDLGAFEISFIS